MNAMKTQGLYEKRDETTIDRQINGSFCGERSKIVNEEGIAGELQV